VKEQGGTQLGMIKRYDKKFKVNVALEALKGEKTLQELAITYLDSGKH